VITNGPMKYCLYNNYTHENNVEVNVHINLT
jgi:hypothetical protein